jgi:hypothetical protein
MDEAHTEPRFFRSFVPGTRANIFPLPGPNFASDATMVTVKMME